MSADDCLKLTKQMEEIMDSVSDLLPQDLKEKFTLLTDKIKRAAIKLTPKSVSLLSSIYHYLLEGYVLLIYEIASLANAIGKASDVKSKIPKEFLPLVDKMERNLTKLQQLIAKMGDDIEEMTKVGSNCI